MKTKKCKMIFIEGAAPCDDTWECSTCLNIFGTSKKFEKLTTCPHCGCKIEWIGVDDEE